MQRLFFISLLFLVVVGGFGQNVFQKAYGRATADFGWTITETSDSGYIIAGESNYNVLLIRTNVIGDTLWTKEYDVPSFTTYVRSIEQTTDKGFVFIQTLNSDTSYLIKTDSIGALLWVQAYGTSGEGIAMAVQQTNDGGFIITGGNGDAFLIKTDSNGVVLWAKAYAGQYWDWGNSVIQTFDGGYIIAGEQQKEAPNNTTQTDILLVKTNSDGDTLWTRTYGDTLANDNGGYSVWQTNDSAFVIVGNTSYGAGGIDTYVIKTDINGDVLWSNAYGLAGDDFCYYGQPTIDGGIIVTGATGSFGAELTFIIRIGDNGDIIWAKTYGGSNYQIAREIKQTSDKGYITVGRTLSGSGMNDIYVIKTDSNGYSGCDENDVTFSITNTQPIIGSGLVVSSLSVGGNSSISISDPLVIITDLCENGTSNNRRPENSNQVIIYPNPTTGTFTVQGTVTEIQVYDLFGRLLLRSNKEQIDMSSYPKGVYVLRIGEATRKVILQ